MNSAGPKARRTIRGDEENEAVVFVYAHSQICACLKVRAIAKMHKSYVYLKETVHSFIEVEIPENTK